jgi:hypothetical protein
MRWLLCRQLLDSLGRARNFKDAVIAPIEELASRTVDIRSVLWGVLGPGTVAERIAHYYRKYLFGEATLQDLPDVPRNPMRRYRTALIKALKTRVGRFSSRSGQSLLHPLPITGSSCFKYTLVIPHSNSEGSLV